MKKAEFCAKSEIYKNISKINISMQQQIFTFKFDKFLINIRLNSVKILIFIGIYQKLISIKQKHY